MEERNHQTIFSKYFSALCSGASVFQKIIGALLFGRQIVNAVELLASLEKYSLICLALAIPVCIVTAILKKGCPERLKKLFTFVPFVLGIVAVGAVRWGELRSFDLPWQNILSDGVRCGGAATVFYVVWEQFLRKKKLPEASAAAITVMGLVEPYVPEESRAGAAKLISEAAASDSDEASAAIRVGELLLKMSNSRIDEQELGSVSEVIVKIVRKL